MCNKYEFKMLMDTCISQHGTLTNTGPVTFQIFCFYRLVKLNYYYLNFSDTLQTS